MTALSFRRGPSGCPAATVRFAEGRAAARPRTTIIQRIVLIIAATLPLVAKLMPRGTITSGDRRFNVSGDEVVLVHHFSTSVARQSLWSVVDHTNDLRIVDFGPKGPKMYRSRKAGVTGRNAKLFSPAEWTELLRRSKEMSVAAPSNFGVQGIRDSDVVDEASDAGSEAGDGGGSALASRPAEPSAPPAPVAAMEPSRDESALAGAMPSLMQIRSVLVRAVPALGLLFGALFYAFPRVGKLAKKAGSVAYTAGSSALTVVEKLAELPDWAWALFFLMLAILYLLQLVIGLEKVWRWLMMVDEASEADRRKRDREAAAARLAAPGGARVKLEPAVGAADAGPAGGGEAARAWQQAAADLGSSRAPREQDGLTADLIGALRGITERLGKLEENRSPPAAASALDAKPAAPHDDLGGGTIDDDLLAALRERRDAFADVVETDRGGAPRRPVAGVSAKDDPDAQLLADLQEAHRRVEKRAVDPIALLKKQIIKPINTGLVKTRMAPSYLIWLYNQKKTLVDYFESFFMSRGLQKTQLCTDTVRIASSIDNLLFDDSIDLFNSTAVERLCRRLYGVEIAIKDVTNQNNLSKADWTMADELDLNNVEGSGFAPENALEEVRKRLERKANVSKWISKSKEHDAPRGPKKDKPE